MADVVPEKILEALEFYELHAPVWQARAGVIGLQSSQTVEMSARVAAARAAFEARQAKAAEARAATIVQTEAMESMRTFGAGLIETIRAFAKSTEDAGVFAAAQIPVPDAPTSMKPETPRDIRFTLRTDGALEVAWKGKAHGGSVAYLVSRSVQRGPNDAPGPMQLVGVVGAKSFIDERLPPGTVSATYSIQAAKGTLVSEPSVATSVRFGCAGDGGIGIGGAAGGGGGGILLAA
jgi:hypothetical protein